MEGNTPAQVQQQESKSGAPKIWVDDFSDFADDVTAATFVLTSITEAYWTNGQCNLCV